jgi:hypothetical protein
MKRKTIRNGLLCVLLLLLAAFTFIGGCEEETTPPPSSGEPTGLASTMVPDTDFDVYVYAKQAAPTVIPGEVVGAQQDITVDSLALWGVAGDDAFSFGGGIAFTGPDEPAMVEKQIEDEKGLWTKISDLTLYFVREAGQVTVPLEQAIQDNDFVPYDDDTALYEVSLLPDGGTTVRAAVAVMKPSGALVSLAAEKVAPESSALLKVLVATANPQVITAGLYSSEQLDIAALSREGPAEILDRDIGLVFSLKSGWPGVVVGPIFGEALESAGYVKTPLGDLTVYKGYVDVGEGARAPIYFRVRDNRVFAAVSGQDSYAQALITGLKL